MRVQDLAISGLRLNRHFMGRLLDGVSDAGLAAQPAGIVNHAAWQVGHIVVTLGSGIQLMGGSYRPPADWNAKFMMGSQPVADPAQYPTKAELLAEFERVADAYEAALDAVDDATLDQQNPIEGFRRMCPTIGDAVVLLGTSHMAYHQGQLSAWRRAQGLGAVR